MNWLSKNKTNIALSFVCFSLTLPLFFLFFTVYQSYEKERLRTSWPQIEQDSFIISCHNQAVLSLGTKALEYCKCMLEESKSKYSSPELMLKEQTSAIVEISKECL